MVSNQRIKIGIIGLGTVGTGVVKVLQNYPEIEIKKIAVKDITKKRNIENFDNSILTDNPFDVVNDEEIKVVVEVIGGVEPAYELLTTAINNGKHIVTANKELLAKKGEHLFNFAKEKNVTILYEAAIAGGIPLITPIKTILIGNKLTKIEAILNGTTNYILSKMEKDCVSYETVLKEAQELGYAETDPTGDVEGYDAVYKLATLATISLNQRVDVNKIYREGITKVSANDIKFAKELGYKIKLIAQAQLLDSGDIDARVHPMLVDEKETLASINGVTNSVVLEGFPVGKIMFAGPGAGEFPTASSVVGDILMLQRSLGCDDVLPLMRCNHTQYAKQLDITETKNKYYISITAKNTTGVIGCIGDICGKNNISLASVLQKGIDEQNTACIVVITEICKESDVNNVVQILENNDNIVKINNIIRVME
jgi:homoserine dehydrogenase